MDTTRQPHSVEAERVEQFMALYSSHQRRLYLYAITLLPDSIDAEDVLQEANLVLWRKFGGFEPDTDFLAWACRVAFFEVQNFRRTAGRDRLMFNNDLVEQLAEERDVSPQRGGRRRDGPGSWRRLRSQRTAPLRRQGASCPTRRPDRLDRQPPRRFVRSRSGE